MVLVGLLNANESCHILSFFLYVKDNFFFVHVILWNSNITMHNGYTTLAILECVCFEWIFELICSIMNRTTHNTYFVLFFHLTMMMTAGVFRFTIVYFRRYYIVYTYTLHTVSFNCYFVIGEKLFTVLCYYYFFLYFSSVFISRIFCILKSALVLDTIFICRIVDDE